MRARTSHPPASTPGGDGPPAPAPGHDPRPALISRLFSVGLDLHLVLGLVDHPQATQWLHRAITDLDTSIADIRAVLLHLPPAGAPHPGEPSDIDRPLAHSQTSDGPATAQAIAAFRARLDAQHARAVREEYR
jgi:hypothetical protein